MSEERVATEVAESMDGTDLPNLAVRLVQVFTSPAALFDRLKVRPVWLGAVILIVALGLIVNAFIPEELVRDAMLARLPRDATPEQRQAVEGALGIANTMRWVGTVLFPPIFFALVAAFLMLVYNVMLGGEARFGQLYSLSVHAGLIAAVGGLITLPLVLARGDVETVLGLHLLAPGLGREMYAYRLLAGITLFGVWTTIVLGIGVSRLYPKVSAGKAVGLLLVVYLALKAVLALGGAA